METMGTFSMERDCAEVLGGYLAARLAPTRAMRHALVLGAIGSVLGCLGAIATWNRVDEFGPQWYPLALIASAWPTAWLGGALAQRRAHYAFTAGVDVQRAVRCTAPAS